MKILVINGPNLNLLGTREPDIYGDQTFESYFTELKAHYPAINLNFVQSNIEGEIINFIQEAGTTCDGIVLNAAGYTHTSVAIGDAVAACKVPLVEVHISNIFAREAFRHHSYISGNATGMITGFGLKGYRLAIEALL